MRKFEADGRDVWARQYGPTWWTSVSAAATDAFGGVFVAGTMGKAFVERRDSAGHVMWTQSTELNNILAGYRTVATGIAVDNQGDAIVSGNILYFQSYLDDDPSDGFLVKCRSDGGVVGFGGGLRTSSRDVTTDVAVDANRNVVVVGNTQAVGLFPTTGTGAFVVRYDHNLNGVWARVVGSTPNDVAAAVDFDAAGNVVVAGTTWAPVPGQTPAGEDALVVKYSPSGTVLWVRQFGSTAKDNALGVAADHAGNVIVVGTTAGSLGVGTSPAGAEDFFVRKYDPAGNVLWSRQFGTGSSDRATAVAVDQLGQIIVVGSTQGTLSGQTSAGQRDAFVLRLPP